MDIRIDRGSRVPPSVQLRSQIVSLVERGRLLPGERLPTVRELAAELGLANNTVAKAYRALEEAAFLEGRGRHGTFVADRLPERPTGAEERLAQSARDYARRAGQLGFGEDAALRAVRQALRDG